MQRALALALLFSCGGETSLRSGEGRIGPLPSVLDFGEQRLQQNASLTWQVENDGIGVLSLDAVVTGQAFALAEAPLTIEPGSDAPLTLIFRPESETPHEGLLSLATSDPTTPIVELPLRGMGVAPSLSLAPSALVFGTVAPGESVTRTTTLSASGSGTLFVTSIRAADDSVADAYTWSLPSPLPLTLEPGHAVSLDVTYAPEVPTSGALELETNGMEPLTVLDLHGGVDGDEPPIVTFVEPIWGSAWLDDEPIQAVVQVTDPDDPPHDLLVSLYLDGTLLDATTPDSESLITVPLELAPGEHTLVARALDPAGNLDEASSTVFVYSIEDPIEYAISGGSSPFEYIQVDDDLAIYVDDRLVWADTDGHQSTLAPIPVEASPGSVIRVVATDANACRKAIGDLVLHFGTTRSQPLVSATSASSCPADADYDASYTGPWPNDFIDASITVELP